MKLLHLDSSILGSHSVSRRLSAELVERLEARTPDLHVIYRDLATEPLAHLSGAHLMAAQAGAADNESALHGDLLQGRAVLEEFISADIVVIGVAFYNFAISSQLKAWVDRILVAGQTFRYDSNGRPEGLMGAKRVYLAIARGGFYGPGTPTQGFEHAETYLRSVFGFIGVHEIEVIVAEGLRVGAEQRESALAAATTKIATLAA